MIAIINTIALPSPPSFILMICCVSITLATSRHRAYCMLQIVQCFSFTVFIVLSLRKLWPGSVRGNLAKCIKDEKHSCDKHQESSWITMDHHASSWIVIDRHRSSWIHGSWKIITDHHGSSWWVMDYHESWKIITRYQWHHPNLSQQPVSFPGPLDSGNQTRHFAGHSLPSPSTGPWLCFSKVP